MGLRKNISLMLCSLALGVTIGVLIKFSGVAPRIGAWGWVFDSIGRIGNGLFLWVSACSVISILSKSKMLAAINVLTFLSAMIVANYMYSYFVVEFFVLRVVIFWIIMLIPSTILGYIIWHVKTHRRLKPIVITAGTIVMIYDMGFNPGLLSFPIAATIIVILYVLFLTLILRAKHPAMKKE